MRFASLFSGSSGNCLYINHQDTTLLVDAGLSGIRIQKALASMGASGQQVNGILITHEHADHIKGVGVLSRRFDIPVYATKGTWEGMASCIGNIAERNRRVISPNRSFAIRDLEIHPCSLSHDAYDPVCFAVDCGKTSLAVATDTGTLTPQLKQHLLGHDLVLIESNHDVGMLETGPYPFPLKQRIKGDLGHLSNETAAQMACTLVRSGVKHLLLGHLSAENNYPLLAHSATEQALMVSGIRPGFDVTLEVASREGCSECYQL